MDTVTAGNRSFADQGGVMASSTISYLWRDKNAPRGFRSGVSLHSHTNQSKETLDFLANFGNQFPIIRPILARMERTSENKHGVHVNYSASYWTPPLTPKLAFDLERKQIEKLDVAPMVSITDHDNINAPMLLRSVPSARQIPVSVEWTVPYGDVQAFHLGVHNLPSARAQEWMATLEEFTKNPNPAELSEIMAALNAEPNVLVVFNHPMWDLYIVGRDRHDFLVNEFLLKYGVYLHALELNGLRNWDENRAVRRLAEKWNMLLISGGDLTAWSPTPTSTSPTPPALPSSCTRFAASARATCSSCRSTPSPGSTASCGRPSTPSATTPIFPPAHSAGTIAFTTQM